MSALITESDVFGAANTLRRSHLIDLSVPASELLVQAVLDAVAPAIVARALREAADSVQDHGTATTNASSVRVWLRSRADEIEAGR